MGLLSALFCVCVCCLCAFLCGDCVLSFTDRHLRNVTDTWREKHLLFSEDFLCCHSHLNCPPTLTHPLPISFLLKSISILNLGRTAKNLCFKSTFHGHIVPFFGTSTITCHINTPKGLTEPLQHTWKFMEEDHY